MIDSEFLLYNDDARKLFRRVINVMEYDGRKQKFGKGKELLDSFSLNQCESKRHLIELMDKLELTKPKTNYGVMGCWFGSILFPLLLKRDARRIYGWDMDPHACELGWMLFEEMPRVFFYNQDVWLDTPVNFDECDVIINTSCEHMPPMKDWPHWKKIFKNYSANKKNPYWILQSNNMHGMQDHINTVDTLEEFEEQMHPMLDIVYSDEIEHPFEEGVKRFTIVGKLDV